MENNPSTVPRIVPRLRDRPPPKTTAVIASSSYPLPASDFACPGALHRWIAATLAQALIGNTSVNSERATDSCISAPPCKSDGKPMMTSDEAHGVSRDGDQQHRELVYSENVARGKNTSEIRVYSPSILGDASELTIGDTRARDLTRRSKLRFARLRNRSAVSTTTAAVTGQFSPMTRAPNSQ